MNKLLLSLSVLSLAVGAAAIPAAPATAQVVKGIGVVNVRAAVANSNAFKTAQTQRQTTYAAQIQQANTRQQQIAQQLQPLYTQAETASRAAKPDQAALQRQITQIRQIETNGQRELQQILQPLALSEAYVQEQITAQLNTAVETVAKRRNITLIFDPTSGSPIYADAAYNMTQDVVNELNRLVPSVQIVPPAGWQPREVREAQAAQAGQAAPQPAQQPAPRPQPQGR
jgi:Skp family chaperone for outer membrane proteins